MIAVMMRWLLIALSASLFCVGGSAAFGQPVRIVSVASDGASAAATTLVAVQNELCGRGLGGRCLKGRQACARGTPEQCGRWMAWNKACEACAKKLVKCRHRVGTSPRYTCDRCIAEHDACEAKLRVP